MEVDILRIYEDGTVVHQDDFGEYDGDPQAQSLCYEIYSVPSQILEYVYECCA